MSRRCASVCFKVSELKYSRMLISVLRHNQYWTRHPAHNSLGITAIHQMVKPMIVVGGNNDQIRLQLLCGSCDFLTRSSDAVATVDSGIIRSVVDTQLPQSFLRFSSISILIAETIGA